MKEHLTNSAEVSKPRSVLYPLSQNTIESLCIGDRIEFVPISVLMQLSESFDVGFFQSWAVQSIYDATLIVKDVVRHEDAIEFDMFVELPVFPNKEYWIGADKGVTFDSKLLESNFSIITRMIKKLIRK